jgi:tetratricopeptide (TPR) repeat protein
MRPQAFAAFFCFRLIGAPIAAVSALLIWQAYFSVQVIAQDSVPQTDSAPKETASDQDSNQESAPKSDQANEGKTDAKDDEPATPAGQADLNAAIDARVDASDLDSLQKVIDLAKEALSKGVGESDIEFTKKMIGTTALQKAQKLKEQLSEVRGQQGQMRVLSEIESTLKTALEFDPDLIDALVLRSAVYRVFERQGEALADMTKAIELSESNHESAAKIAELFLGRALIQKDPAAQLSDVSKAAELNPSDANAWQLKIQLLGQSGDNEAAYQAVLKFLETQTDNLKAIELAVALLLDLDKAEDALRVLNEKIPQLPSSAGLLRERGLAKYRLKDNDGAIADYTAALELSPQDILAYRLRAQVNLSAKKYEEASRDVEKIFSLKPDDLGALQLRLAIASDQRRYDEAIADAERLVRRIPDDPTSFLQLADLYLRSDRPRLAIDTCNVVLKTDPKNVGALGLRGNAYLSVGEQKEAVADFEDSLKIVPKEAKDQRSNLLNNLSWVLSTSPKDEIRNAERSLELALEACELTEYKEAHILSTLAAAYAEKGDFEKAREWSTKAIEAGKSEGSEQLEQLEQELKSYQENKPWRELQETTESAKPSVRIENGIDA